MLGNRLFLRKAGPPIAKPAVSQWVASAKPVVGLIENVLRLPLAWHWPPTWELAVAPLWHSGRSGRVELVDGVAELVLDGVVAFRGQYLAARQLADIEAVNGGASLGANLGGGDVHGQLGERLRNGVEQADAVFGLDFEERAGLGDFVVEVDVGGDSLAHVGLVERPGNLLPPDQGGEVHFFAGKGFEEDALEAVPLVGAGQVARDSVGDKEGVQDDVIGAREDRSEEH